MSDIEYAQSRYGITLTSGERGCLSETSWWLTIFTRGSAK